jgi:hypothetical protein
VCPPSPRLARESHAKPSTGPVDWARRRYALLTSEYADFTAAELGWLMTTAPLPFLLNTYWSAVAAPNQARHPLLPGPDP